MLPSSLPSRARMGPSKPLLRMFGGQMRWQEQAARQNTRDSKNIAWQITNSGNTDMAAAMTKAKVEANHKKAVMRQAKVT